MHPWRSIEPGDDQRDSRPPTSDRLPRDSDPAPGTRAPTRRPRSLATPTLDRATPTPTPIADSEPDATLRPRRPLPDPDGDRRPVTSSRDPSTTGTPSGWVPQTVTSSTSRSAPAGAVVQDVRFDRGGVDHRQGEQRDHPRGSILAGRARAHRRRAVRDWLLVEARSSSRPRRSTRSTSRRGRSATARYTASPSRDRRPISMGLGFERRRCGPVGRRGRLRQDRPATALRVRLARRGLRAVRAR